MMASSQNQQLMPSSFDYGKIKKQGEKTIAAIFNKIKQPNDGVLLGKSVAKTINLKKLIDK